TTLPTPTHWRSGPARRSRSRGDEVEVVLEDPGGRAPDRVAAVVEEIDRASGAVALPVLDAKAARRGERGERDLDHALHLRTVRAPRDGLADDAHPGRDDERRGDRLGVLERVVVTTSRTRRRRSGPGR